MIRKTAIRKMVTSISFGIFAMAMSVMASAAAVQDNFPSSPIRLVVGFPPPSTTNTIARLLTQQLAVQMNVNVVVDNRIGANGNIGAEYVARSNPTGYTLLLNTSGVILTRALGEKVNFDVLEDLVPVALIASAPQWLVVHPAVPANNAAEFIAHLKTNPDKLAYGSSGVGNITHLGPLLFLQLNGLSALHVPYKGAAPAVVDLAAGRIQFRFSDMLSVMPLVKDKRLKVLAVAGLNRFPLMPDVPTLHESGMRGFEVGSWFGVMAPPKTSSATVKKLNVEILRAMQEPEVKSQLARDGVTPLTSSPEEYGAYLRTELERWTKVIGSAGIKSE